MADEEFEIRNEDKTATKITDLSDNQQSIVDAVRESAVHVNWYDLI